MDERIFFVLIFPLILVVLGLLIWSLVWAYGDAEKRGKSGALVALMIFFMNWPFSLLIWLVFRPELKASPPSRQ